MEVEDITWKFKLSHGSLSFHLEDQDTTTKLKILHKSGIYHIEVILKYYSSKSDVTGITTKVCFHIILNHKS